MDFDQNFRENITMEQYQGCIFRVKHLEMRVNEEIISRVSGFPIGQKWEKGDRVQ
jgi:hypothetical protein